MVSPGRGILAADESIKTMSSRLEKVGIAPTADARRAYREMLVTTPGIAEGISGIIFCDETLNQQLSDGRPFAQATREAGMLPGVKVDTGAKPLAGRPGETITEGLDGLSARLAGYAAQGAAFAKWRAVLRITDDLPSTTAIRANAHALARYAAACQEAGLVPIVEPEVLMDGDHTLRRCAEVTARVHAAVMAELAAFGVDMAGVVLKPNMVVEGADHPHRATPEEVAEATVDVRVSAADHAARTARRSRRRSVPVRRSGPGAGHGEPRRDTAPPHAVAADVLLRAGAGRSRAHGVGRVGPQHGCRAGGAGRPGRRQLGRGAHPRAAGDGVRRGPGYLKIPSRRAVATAPVRSLTPSLR